MGSSSGGSPQRGGAPIPQRDGLSGIDSGDGGGRCTRGSSHIHSSSALCPWDFCSCVRSRVPNVAIVAKGIRASASSMTTEVCLGADAAAAAWPASLMHITTARLLNAGARARDRGAGRLTPAAAAAAPSTATAAWRTLTPRAAQPPRAPPWPRPPRLPPRSGRRAATLQEAPLPAAARAARGGSSPAPAARLRTSSRRRQQAGWRQGAPHLATAQQTASRVSATTTPGNVSRCSDAA